MRSPVLALTWQVWRPQRWLWGATALYILLLALGCRLLPVGELAHVLTVLSLAPLALAPLFAIGTLTLAPGADLGARQSAFPSWMFTLPLRTPMLVGWVMLNGLVGLLALGTAVIMLILQPSGLPVPACLALVMPAMLAWLQVLIWTPFSYPILRMPLVIVMLTANGLGPTLLATRGPRSPGLAVAALLGSITVAFGLALVGVSQARHGAGLEGRQLPLNLDALLNKWRRRRPFASPAAAQLWYEWCRNGYIFPLTEIALLAISIPLCLFIPDRHPVVLLLGLNPLLPVLLSQSIGMAVGKGDVTTKDYYYPAFLTVRPLSSVDFVRAKLAMTARSALAACMVGILPASVLLLLRNHWEVVQGYWRAWLDVYPTYKAWTILALVPVVLFLLTWKNLAVGLWVGLTGRAWIGGVLAVAGALGLLVIGLLGALLYHQPQYLALVLLVLPWLVGAFLLARACLAVCLVWILCRRRLVVRSQVARGVGLWFLMTFCVCGLAWWLVPENILSLPWLLCSCLFLVPFNRIALAPLALEWNRHR
jgi:hypothetical protein